MATYQALVSVHETLTANTADLVEFETDIWPLVEVLNRDPTNALYFRVDGTTAVVGAPDTYVVMPGGALIAPVSFATGTQSSGIIQKVSIISAGAVAYSVTGITR